MFVSFGHKVIGNEVLEIEWLDVFIYFCTLFDA